MTAIEALAALLTLANVWLVVRRSVWNFPVALVAVTMTAVVLVEAKLYSDAGLQGFFFVLNLYGWWAWSRNRADSGTIIVGRLTTPAYVLIVVAALAATYGWGQVMGATTDASAPFLDASIAMFSVAAQILMTQRKIENWHVWIVVNLISIGVYWMKGLYWFTGLYVILLVIAVRGLAEWRAAEARQRT
jgi:nicotinamide mononucleotide transporter